LFAYGTLVAVGSVRVNENSNVYISSRIAVVLGKHLACACFAVTTPMGVDHIKIEGDYNEGVFIQ